MSALHDATGFLIAYNNLPSSLSPLLNAEIHHHFSSDCVKYLPQREREGEGAREREGGREGETERQTDRQTAHNELGIDRLYS